MSDRSEYIDNSVPGIRITISGDPESPSVTVHTPEAMTDWSPYVIDVTREESRRTPTTIKYRGVFYAISEIEHEGPEWRYSLIPWPEPELVRRTVTLSREVWEQARREEEERKAQQRRDHIARGLGPLIAFLPARWQEEISDRYDYDAPGWTRVNAAIVGLAALSATAVFDVVMPIAAGYGFGGGYGGPLITLAAPYFAIDSFIRYAHARAGDKPLGILVLEVLDRLVEALFRKN